MFEYLVNNYRSGVLGVAKGAHPNLRGYAYTGEEYDSHSGLLYLRARFYDASIGRFISADPYWGRLEEPVTQNRYAYVHNNPLGFVDPTGLAPVHLWNASAAARTAYAEEGGLLGVSTGWGFNLLSGKKGAVSLSLVGDSDTNIAYVLTAEAGRGGGYGSGLYESVIIGSPGSRTEHFSGEGVSGSGDVGKLYGAWSAPNREDSILNPENNGSGVYFLEPGFNVVGGGYNAGVTGTYGITLWEINLADKAVQLWDEAKYFAADYGWGDAGGVCTY